MGGVRDRATALRRESGGSVLIETSLALLVAMPLFFAVFELCMFTYTQSVLSDAAREGSVQKNRPQKVTVKMIFPLVLFVFPCMFIVLLGPAIIAIMHGMEALKK